MGPVPRPASGVLHGHHGRITPPAREAKRRFSKRLPAFRCSFHRRGNRSSPLSGASEIPLHRPQDSRSAFPIRFLSRQGSHLLYHQSPHKSRAKRFIRALARNRAVHSELCTAGIIFRPARQQKARRSDFETAICPTGIPVGHIFTRNKKGAAGSIDCGSAFFIIQEIRFLRKPAHLPDGYSPFCKKVST